MQRIICVNPEHKENTPSMVIYEDRGYCFGCGITVPLSELNRPDLIPVTKPEPEDLPSTLAYIKSLPLVSIRGLFLPADEDNYYIVWPSNDYYKRRKFIPGESSKYLCPKGHSKPLFIAAETPNKTAVLVEGELNAISLASLNLGYTIISPGGCGDFNDRNFDKIMQNKYFYKASRVILLLDKDVPGLDAAKRTKNFLLQNGFSNIIIRLLKQDCNELLVRGELEQETNNW